LSRRAFVSKCRLWLKGYGESISALSLYANVSVSTASLSLSPHYLVCIRLFSARYILTSDTQALMKDRASLPSLLSSILNTPLEVAKLRILKIPVYAFTSETSKEERDEVNSGIISRWDMIFNPNFGFSDRKGP
jgi:hypothetical protein